MNSVPAVRTIITKNKSFVENLRNFSDTLNALDQECSSFFKELDNFLETGNIDDCKILNVGKENDEPIIAPTNKRRGRGKKPALADITENNVQDLSSDPVNIKKEKISQTQKVLQNSTFISAGNVEIKSEEMPAPTKLPPRKKKIKTENVEVSYRSTRTRTRSKKQDLADNSSETEKYSMNKLSDVIIQNTTITTIDISDGERDTEDESDVIENSKPQKDVAVRSTRSKVQKQQKLNAVQDQVKRSLRNEANNEESERTDAKKITKPPLRKQKKRIRSDSSPTSETERKKSKSDSNTDEAECNGSIRTEYEDAVSSIESNQENSQNSTYIASSKNLQYTNKNAIDSPINTTVVVDNPKIVKHADPTKDLQDDFKNEFEQRPRTPPRIAAKVNTQIFSPFEKTSLKKKVEAFEKLRADSSGIPTRITRTKKKKAQKDGDADSKNIEADDVEKKSTEKSKLFTPISSKFQPKGCSTSKIHNVLPVRGSDMSLNSESLLSVKSASALKASQAEFREREKRRQEKESIALRKREALLQAQTEEKRKKREEKQQKAQQQRDIIEKEKQKLLEVQRLKEAKHKQAVVEREEKWQRQKEEAEKKRLMAKKKAFKEKEEAMKLAEQQRMADLKSVINKQSEIAKSVLLKQKMERAQQQQELPIYMTTKPPLLPTDDCYDSDDPDYKEKGLVIKRNPPAWSKDRALGDMQMVAITAGEAIKNTFYCRQVHTPDLRDIFEIIDPRKLKRTSSAVWRKPPRYTLMPTIIDDQCTEYSD